MIHKTSPYLILLFFLMLPGVQSAFANRLNLTDQIEYIGNPYLDRYPAESQRYARNIWDMIFFNGKLYLGAGNSSNAGPAPNAGPVPIISYDPESNLFSSDFIVDEEQIDVFHALDGMLYIPGHDPKENWSLGNFYSLPPGGLWQKHRTIPHAIHTYSMTSFDNKLFAALGTQEEMSVVVSGDGGLTWEGHNIGSGRIYDFLRVKDRLYAIGVFFSEAILAAKANSNLAAPVSCHEYTPGKGFKPRLDLSDSGLFFPNVLPKSNKTFKISKRLFTQHETVFIGAEIHNDHQSLPFGVFVASASDTGNVRVENIPIPSFSRPWDILRERGHVYILLEHLDKNPKEISVIWSSDLRVWEELFYLQLTTFARSFAILNNSLYFSAGGEISNPWKWRQTEISEDTGKIYKVDLPQ